LLDITAVPRVNLLNAGPLVWRLFHGSIKRVAKVTHLQGAQFVIERTKPGWIHTDGEPRATTAKLEITIKPRSLKIMVPGTVDRDR
jgi:diacylglycerol kinase family enzyme